MITNPTPRTLRVSLDRTFDPNMTLAQAAECASGNWYITPAKAKTCDRVVAVYAGQPVGAWRLLNAAYSDEFTKGVVRRTMLSLGEPLPIRGTDFGSFSMRRGVAVA